MKRKLTVERRKSQFPPGTFQVCDYVKLYNQHNHLKPSSYIINGKEIVL
jgi:hypothetical protein